MTIQRVQTPPALDSMQPLQAGRMVKDTLAAVADGNGLMSTQIRIAREDSHIARLDGEISVAFSHRLQRDQIAGRNEDGTVVSSEEQAVELATQKTAALPHNAALRDLVMAEISRQTAQGWGMAPLRFTLGKSADDVFCLHESCAACASKTNPACAICKGSGITTRRLTARYTADISFTLWRQGADVTALAAADALGVVALATHDLADIFIGAFVADGTRLRATCTAVLPVAKVDLSLEGRFVSAIVAGKQAEIVTLDPFLDKFIKPGVAALLKLSRGPLAVETLLMTALKYRAVRQAVHGVLLLPRSGVYRQLQRDYPIGISDKYLRASVKYAAAAQEALTVAPRLAAARIACVLSLVIIAAYFFALRTMVPDAMVALAVDAAVFVMLCIMTTFIIRKLAARALTTLLRAPKGPKILRSAGSAAPKAWGVIAMIFVGCAMVASQTPVYAEVLKNLLRMVFPTLI